MVARTAAQKNQPLDLLVLLVADWSVKPLQVVQHQEILATKASLAVVKADRELGQLLVSFQLLKSLEKKFHKRHEC